MLKSSIVRAILVRRYHEFDVHERRFAPLLFEQLKKPMGLTRHIALLLAVVDLIADVLSFRYKYVKDGQQLSVVRDKRSPDHVVAQHQLPDHVDDSEHDSGISSD